MIKLITIHGKHEIETDSRKFFKSTIKRLEREGMSEGVHFLIREFSPKPAGKKVDRGNKRRPVSDA